MQNMQKNLLNYTRTDLERGSVLAMEKSCPLVSAMEFKQVSGSAYAWNVINDLLDTKVRELGESVVSGEMETVKVVRPLEIISNSCKVDRSISIMEDITSVQSEAQALEMASMGKAVERKIIADLKKFITDDTAGKEFAGALDMTILEDCFDYCEPNLILANPKTIRAMKAILKAEGYIDNDIESFGKRVSVFNGVPIHVSKDLVDGEVLMLRLDIEAGVGAVTNKGVVVYNRVENVFNVTDTEFIFTTIVKTSNSFGLVKPVAKVRK